MMPKNYLETLAERSTAWLGSISSLVTHTIFFLLMLALPALNIDTTKVLLILTTIVSLEAIYLSIFIQFSVNRHSQALEEVAEDIEGVSEEVEEISEEVEEISEEVGVLSEDVEGMSENLEEKKLKPGQTPNSLEEIEAQLTILLQQVKQLRQIQK